MGGFNELNVDNSTQVYLEKINILLGTYEPLKRIDKYKLRFNSKPWITLRLKKPISVKNKLLTKLINTKHPILKKETHIENKNYRNIPSTVMKKRRLIKKQAYYNKYFETNWNNIKNTWKGIKSLISLKAVASSAPTMLYRDNGNTNGVTNGRM